MFEKEAEKWIENNLHSTEEDYIKAFKDGAEFGYNKGYHDAEEHYMNVIDSQHKLVEESKANEWHYVKDGDLPKDDKQYLVLFFYNYRGKKEMSCGVRDNLHSDFETNRCYTEQIIAWKEIVLPELPKESK